MVEPEDNLTTMNHATENETTNETAANSRDVGGASDGAAGASDDGQDQSAGDSLPFYISLTPPEDCVSVTKDRGVLKKVLEAGDSDDKPTLHARCLIHYIGYLASSGEVFMNTRTDRETEEPAVVVAGRTAAAQETGLCLAAATMSRGERALVYITDPVYGYGALGSFSFPCVPPSSQLVYEVEMVHWEGVEETDNDGDRSSLLFEERLERAERRREAGNGLYKAGRNKEALAKYALALSYMDEDFMYQLEGHYLDKAEAVKTRVHLNMAAAQLRTGDYNTAIYNCGQVLNMDPNNVKALFRRGKARHALGRSEEAAQDLEAALKLDPDDPAIKAEMRALKLTRRKEEEAVRALYKDRLKASPAAAAAAASPATVSSPATAEAQATLSDPATKEGSGRAGQSQLSKRAAATAGVGKQQSRSGNAGGGATQPRGMAKAAAPGVVAVAARGLLAMLATALADLMWVWTVLAAAAARPFRKSGPTSRSRGEQ